VPRKSSKSKTTGKTSPTRHFCRYPACRENPRNRKLPAKPLPHGSFAGIPRAAKIFEIENYRQNLSHTPLLPVSRAPRKSSKSKTTGKTSPTRLFCRYPTCRENLRNRKLTGKTSPTRHFCRYPACRENPRNRKLPAKPLPHASFAGIPRAAKILEIENYRQNLSHTALLPVSRAPRKSSKSKTTGKTSPTRLFCRYPACRKNLRNRKLPAKPLPHASFAGNSPLSNLSLRKRKNFRSEGGTIYLYLNPSGRTDTGCVSRYVRSPDSLSAHNVIILHEDHFNLDILVCLLYCFWISRRFCFLTRGDHD